MLVCRVGARCDIGIIILYPFRLTQEGQTPLHLAAKEGQIEVVGLFLDASPPADINKASTRVGTRTHHPMRCFALKNRLMVVCRNPYLLPLEKDTATSIRLILYFADISANSSKHINRFVLCGEVMTMVGMLS